MCSAGSNSHDVIVTSWWYFYRTVIFLVEVSADHTDLSFASIAGMLALFVEYVTTIGSFLFGCSDAKTLGCFLLGCTLLLVDNLTTGKQANTTNNSLAGTSCLVPFKDPVADGLLEGILLNRISSGSVWLSHYYFLGQDLWIKR